MKVSSSWRLQGTEIVDNAFVEIIIRSACPSEDDVIKIKPIQVINENNNNGLQRRSFHVYMPPRLCSIQQPNKKPNNGIPPLRIILAIHGYGARPMQEIKKWHNVAISLNAIILAPQIGRASCRERV